MSPVSHSRLLDDPLAQTLASGDLAAVFLPGRGMLGASLRHRGVEILRRVEDLEAAAAKGFDGRDPASPPLGEPARGAALPRGGQGDDPRSGVTPSPPRRASPADARGPVVPARVERGGRDIRERVREPRLVPPRPSRRLSLCARAQDDRDPRSGCADDRDDAGRWHERGPGQLRLSPLRRPAGRAARRVDAAAPGHAAPRSRRERHPDGRGDPGFLRRRSARRPRIRRRLRAPRGIPVVFDRGRRPPGDGGTPFRIRVRTGLRAPGKRSSSPSSR